MDDRYLVYEQLTDCADDLYGQPFEELDEEDRNTVIRGVYAGLEEHYAEQFYWEQQRKLAVRG